MYNHFNEAERIQNEESFFCFASKKPGAKCLQTCPHLVPHKWADNCDSPCYAEHTGRCRPINTESAITWRLIHE